MSVSEIQGIEMIKHRMTNLHGTRPPHITYEDDVDHHKYDECNECCAIVQVQVMLYADAGASVRVFGCGCEDTGLLLPILTTRILFYKQ